MSMATIASSYVSDTYGPEVLVDNPLFYLEFDETTGDYLDKTVNNYTFPYNSGQRGAAGVRPESKASVQGVGTYLGTKNATLAAFNGSFTLEQWFTVPATNVSGAWFGFGENNGWTVGFGNGTMDSAGRQIIVLANYVGWAPMWTMPNGALTFHVVMTATSTGTWTLWINGVNVATVGRSWSVGSGWTTLGGLREGGAFIRPLSTGIRFDSFSAYASVLSDTRIKAHYAAGVASVVKPKTPVTFGTQTLPSGWVPDKPVVFQNQPDAVAGTTYAMEFADIPDSGSTYVDFTANSDGWTPMVVRYLIQSEGNYDFFRLYVNGTQVATDSGNPGVYKVFTASLPPGDNAIRLSYTKDGSGSTGFDNVRISQVSW